MNSLRNKLSNRKLMQNGFVHLQSYSSSTSPTNIQIPNRKERGPTDILMALESTIRRDPTAPHYKYIDDPNLLPITNLEKRSYALSKEAGRKAAMWVRQEHAEYFQHKVAEPFIDYYAPRAVYTEKDNVSEEILLNNIKSGYVKESLEIYNLLEQNVKIETKLALFELLCFYNSMEQIDEELMEERWYSSNSILEGNNWKECSDKQHLFHILTQEKGDIATAAYNVMITGLIKFNNLVKAWDLYEECKENNIPLYKITYDHLIKAIIIAKHNDGDRLILMQQMYKEMMINNLRPDVKTMNASLHLLSVLKIVQKSSMLSMILNEFKSINVKPSLASHYYILKCFSKSNQLLKTVLTEIMDILENENLKEFSSIEDALFFPHAMQCAYYAKSMILCKRLNNLMLKDDNYKLIRGNYQENVYYRNYLLLHLKLLSPKSFKEVYLELTPHIYTPEMPIFKEILDSLIETESSEVTDILQYLCSQAILFEYTKSSVILENLVDLMCNHCKPTADSTLNKSFAEIALQFWTQMQEANMTSRRGYTYEASTLEKLSLLCVRGGEFDKMLEILSTLINNQNIVIATMSPKGIKELFTACLANGHCEAALSLIEYAIESGFDEQISMGMKVYKTFQLSAAQESRLQSLVGKDFKKYKLNNEES